MREFIEAGADLFLGASCPGCGRPALRWCRDCADQVRPQPRLVDTRLSVPVAAAGLNAGVLQTLIVAWKEHGRAGLLEPLSVLLASSVCLVVPDGPIDLVPVVSSRANVRRRGADVVADLAVGAAAVLRGIGLDARMSPRLSRSRSTRDQAGLDTRARRANMSGVFAARPGGRPSVLVDDILTSGATAADALRALGVSGPHPLGVAVAAWTPPPSRDVRPIGYRADPNGSNV